MQHAAAVVGRRMVVVGGQTVYGPSNDVQVSILQRLIYSINNNEELLTELSCLQMLHLSKMTWSELGRNARNYPNGQVGKAKTTPGQLPPCKGHSLVRTFPLSFILSSFM